MSETNTKQYWQPIDLLKALGVAVFVFIVGSHLRFIKSIPKPILINYEEILSFCTAIWYLQRKYRLTRDNFGMNNEKYKKMIVVGAIGGLILSINNIKTYFIGSSGGLIVNDPKIFINKESGNWYIVQSILFIAVLLPIIEEILFRGFIYRILKYKYNYIIAAVVTSILWGVMHLGVGSVLYSFIFIAIYEYSGSIGSSIIAHIMMNAIGCINGYISYW